MEAPRTTSAPTTCGWCGHENEPGRDDCAECVSALAWRYSKPSNPERADLGLSWGTLIGRFIGLAISLAMIGFTIAVIALLVGLAGSGEW
jgi:hypothetical protein